MSIHLTHDTIQSTKKITSMLDADGDETRSLVCWWRSAKEFDEKGHLKIDLSNISDLAPRLKVLRQMERLALIVPEALDVLRYKLISYLSGDLYLPTGGINKEGMEIPPVITILLVGFVGSGKSSLINHMYSVLGRAGLIPFAQTSQNSSNYNTMYLEEHNVLRSTRNGFCVFDSRGLDYDRMAESFDGLSDWMADGVHHHQECWRASDDVSKREALRFSSSESSKYAKRRVNCVVVVASVAEIYRALKSGDPKPLEATRELFYCPAIKKCNDNPILILTHGDKLSTDERLEGRLKICEFLGISATTGTYDIACVTEHGFLADESDPVAAYALTEALYRALLFSDRTHPAKKSFKDWLFVCISWVMCSMAAFFAFLAYCFSRLGEKTDKLKTLVEGGVGH